MTPEKKWEMETDKRVVIISAHHDYRTKKRASIHHIAESLVNAGFDVTFISTRFSLLSRYTKDSRVDLSQEANRFEIVDGVRCYLWKTFVHPFKSNFRYLDAAMNGFYKIFAAIPNATFDKLVSAADYVLVDSSAAVIYLPRIRNANANAKIVYYATDLFDTTGAHPFLGRQLFRHRNLIDHFSLRSPRMRDHFEWASDRLYLAEFGIDTNTMDMAGETPYPPGVKVAVSVGSMLFDPFFFQSVAPYFPDVEFHVIGCGTTFRAPANVQIHKELSFAATLPYIKHATVGVAAYRDGPGAEYLAESSLKLVQYGFFGKASVCPGFAVGGNPDRFGYTIGDVSSMRTALQRALNAGELVPSRQYLSWTEVALRILEPRLFSGTSLAARCGA